MNEGGREVGMNGRTDRRMDGGREGTTDGGKEEVRGWNEMEGE